MAGRLGAKNPGARTEPRLRRREHQSFTRQTRVDLQSYFLTD